MPSKPGIDVSLSSLVMAGANAVKAWRAANEQSERVWYWLADNPVIEGVDPLMQEPFNLDENGAYLYRFVFGAFHDLDVESPLTAGRKLTGLE